MDQLTAPTLEAALLKGCASFAPDELAYLALTSKPEGPIRDRLAWVLHTSVPGVIAAREWASPLRRARTDLAVLDAATHAPLGLVELKASYTFDFAHEHMLAGHKYTQWVADDLEKAHAAGAGTCPVFALLLLTNPAGVSEQPSSVVKYRPNVARSLRGRTADDVAAIARTVACAHLSAFGTVANGTIDAGTAFGIATSIEYFLVAAAR
ncbi:hypothetical protein LO763_21995 [Glycomyces sp. A-F 0318]|uniref:hypothetical protein n=1 Tax=Glycomyces amatae TaxID=2881355 RepID=UPI001E648C8E|nr:hypothetical protein [Glycomyces amatae]MCD0446289.1 hypothetical protein [Glycomyces amatae]